MTRKRVVLAYSGGLDTSIAIKWIQDNYDMDVIAFTCDLGQGRDLEPIRRKALAIGAIDAVVTDLRDTFVEYFVWPSLMAGALYEGKYPLATALSRPLIAWKMIEIAKQYGATCIAHGCTGKGNDQVRFDLTAQILAPRMKVIAPLREWKFTRSSELKYAEQNKIEIDVHKEHLYSIDQNLWGRSIEAGPLEDPWIQPPREAFEWTVDPRECANEGVEIEIEFEQGRPIALDGMRMSGRELIERLNKIGGEHGVGRIDHVESRLVGIKSREVYEAPAAVILHLAHRELEYLTLPRQSLRFNTSVSQAVSDAIYDGLWFSNFHQDLLGYIARCQRYVSGQIRVRLYAGSCTVTGRKSEYSLYSKALATYDEGDQFPHETAVGFIQIYGLSLRTQAERQLLQGSPEVRSLGVVPPALEK